MTDEGPDSPPRAPRAELVEKALRVVPLLEAYFRHAHVEMPAELRLVFAKNHLSARHAAVLSQLTVAHTLGVGELAHRMRVSIATVSELVSDLGQAGLLQRREDPGDRRKVLVSLAETARPSVEEFVAVRSAPLLRVLQSMGRPDRQVFADGLAAWARETED
ncbi:MarR family winged helix-turn-helix transcriptional regulator [Actinoalloteichus hymeniacidonis]|uniref:MarR family winged helix-turn-helix transcriptional regulator n=1 Tax=Actinoalloteichus hymeniacidonis TaxID=340345 RepID=UPI00180021FB|nr:MarR family transcriptional regulator [Actinoalloteichus hymeniacidonis]MBB5908088.1 DNA-binding MarR family transcriptional regulator [Actinoalloteichus hymeniacidonis]